MKLKKVILAGLLAAFSLSAANFPASAAIPMRGIVEGFYGTPWTNEKRIMMMDFCRRYDLNAYIYAPKDDPWHRAKWREPYPEDKKTELADLIKSARKNKVRFVFAVSPGLDLHYDGAKGAADKQFMLKKFAAMYDLGVRDFAVFFDDIKDLNGQKQAEFINYLQKHFVDTHEGVSPLITVPTQYHRLNMVDEKGKALDYTEKFAATLDKSVLVLYTGEKVVSDGLTDEDLKKAEEIYGRNLGIWWNYPVNDYAENKLALGAIYDLPKKEVPRHIL